MILSEKILYINLSSSSKLRSLEGKRTVWGTESSDSGGALVAGGGGIPTGRVQCEREVVCYPIGRSGEPVWGQTSSSNLLSSVYS